MKINSKGISLIAVIIIMLLVASLSLVIASTMSTAASASIIDMQGQQALYIADAGLKNYIYLLYDKTYTPDDHPELTNDFGEGSYTVTSSYDEDASVYTLTSTATVDTLITRQITQSVAVTSAILERAVHADSSHVRFGNSTAGVVNGNISCFVSVQDADDLANYTDFVDGTYLILEGNQQDKVNPTIDTSMYLDLAEEDGEGHHGVDLTFSADTYDGVYYATNSVTIQDGAIINGSVVCEKGINFDDGPITVMIRPELSTRVVEGEDANYAALIAGVGGIISTDTGAPEARRGLTDSTINGLVMCSHSGSDIKFNYMDGATFNGTIIATSNIELQDADTANDRSFVISYDEDIFVPMISGFTYDIEGVITIIPQLDWDEVTP